MKKTLILAALLLPAAAQAADGAGAPASRFVELYIVHLAVVLALVTAASEVLERRVPAACRRLRLGWNWLLLASFVVCVVTGFMLLTPMERELRHMLFKWHVWTGAAAAWAGLYHTAKRARCMLPDFCRMEGK